MAKLPDPIRTGLSSKPMMARPGCIWKTWTMLKPFTRSRIPLGWRCAGLFLAVTAVRLAAQSDQAVYTDSLQNGWEDWSWSAARDFNGSSQIHSGAKAISVNLSAWGALSLHHDDIDTSAYSDLTFWVHGGTAGGQQLKIYAELGTTAQPSLNLPTLIANTWRQVTLSLASLGADNKLNFTRFSIQDVTGTVLPTFFVDDLALVSSNSVPGTSGPVVITVNAALNPRPINPLIYGVAFASANQLSELNAPLNRWGGNSTTRYNWQLNADNKANDWYFQSIGFSSSTPGAEADSFITSSKAGGAAPVLTLPMLGWMPKLGPSRSKLWSYSIAKYGPQTGNDWQWNPDSGNGLSATNPAPITWNDPNDANYLTNSAFQQAWVRHLTNTWGLATNGGVRYYCMDNEYALWHSTHRDVHPGGAPMQEIRDKLFDYGAKVKAVDPHALLLAPEEWGWPGYLYSGYDWQWADDHGNWNPASFPDRAANGGLDYAPWLLDQARQYELTNGRRLLDVFTLHIYPQGANEFTSDVSTNTQVARNRSTRALWDPNYVDQSWISSVIKLIPRMRDWVATSYPGTQIGITEYNWGAEDHINGATAQADLLGIFGREGLDLATRWTTPASSTPTFKAMKMYRNYDGNQSTFGDLSVFAGGPNPDHLASFAAQRSADGALTLMAINKPLGSNTPVTVTLTNFLPAGLAQVWQLTAANTITHLSDIAFTGAAFSTVLPAQSITLFVVPGGAPPALRALGAAGGNFNFRLEGLAAQRYAILTSPDLANWMPVQTNTLATASVQISLPATNAARFYRAQWLP